jgi:hypothetical protein
MRRALFLLTLAAGCAGGDAGTSIGRVVVDTLPDGTPRTMTAAAVGWSDTNGWKLVEVLRLTGETEGPGGLVHPGSVAIDGAGRIYVAEREPAVVKQFSPDGAFIRTIGRGGSGPGEFEVPFVAAAGAHLYVHDPVQARTSLFDTSGAYVRSWPTYGQNWSGIVVDAEGQVGVPGPPPRGATQDDKNPFAKTVWWYRADSTVADSLLVPTGPEVQEWVIQEPGKRGRMSMDIPFSPAAEHLILADHRVIFGFSDRYQLAVTTRDGADTVALFGREWAPLPVAEERRAAEVERRVNGSKKWFDERLLRNEFQVGEIPATAPAFDWLGRDARGAIWVRTPVPSDSNRTLFDVFDPEYRWLGQVSGSAHLGKLQAQLIGDRMVAVGESMEGDPLVVVYRIERTGP